MVIAGATGATLDTTGRAGQSISLRVTWSNGIGSPAVATSNAIAIVMLFITGYIYGGLVPQRPWLSAMPLPPACHRSATASPSSRLKASR